MCQAMLWPIQQILLSGRKGRNDLAFKWEFWKARSPEMVPSATTCCYQEAQGCLIILTFSTLSHNSYPSTTALLLVLAPRLAKSLDESIQLFTIKNHSFLPSFLLKNVENAASRVHQGQEQTKECMVRSSKVKENLLSFTASAVSYNFSISLPQCARFL